MEGCRRGLAAWLAATLAGCALVLGASGCGGDDEPSAAGPAVKTSNPEEVFAPLVEVAADERWRPMSARWFIERSVFWFADDQGCRDLKIAVGHTLPEQQNPVTDWIFPKGLGGWIQPAYYRTAYDKDCDTLPESNPRLYADQLTRPHDPGPRPDGVRPTEGFYLDLVDEARPGPVLDGPLAETVYAERSNEGDDEVRLTYWMLFGMNGTPGDPAAHEGDWERVDVVLRDLGDGRYEPLSVGSGQRETPWLSARRVEGTHPVVRLASATHAPTVTRPGASCRDCTPWKTWRSLAPARKEPWYGFGGAWGEVGSTDATTGPLGPRR